MRNSKVVFCFACLMATVMSGTVAAQNRIDDLLAMDLEELMQVTVASKASESVTEAPGIITVVTEEDIKRYGDKNLGDILNHLPSFHILSSYHVNKNYASIRASSLTHYDNHTLILLNGRPVRDSGSGSMGNSMYRAFPVEAIKRIEVIRGPGSALYGTNAFAGVINIVTKGATDAPDYRVDASYGTNNHRQAFVSKGVSYKGAEMYVAGRFSEDEGWDRKFTDENSVFHNDDYEAKMHAVLATLNYENFNINAYSSAGFEEAINIVPIGSGTYNKIHRQHVDVGYKFDVTNDLYVNTNVTFNGSIWSPIPNPELESKDYLGEVTAHYDILDNLKLIVGGTAEYRSGFVPSANKYHNNWYGTYFQTEYKPVEKLKFVAGGQYNKIESLKGSFSPRFAAIYNHNENLGVKLLYGEAFRGASAAETDFNHPVLVGNAALTPEEIATYDAQIFYNTKDYNLSATYFHSKITDIVSRTLLSGTTFTYVNAGEIEVSGVELEANWDISPQWSVMANATFQGSEDNTGGVDVTHDSNIMIKGGVVYDTQRGIVTSVYDSYFGDAALIDGAAVVNPPAEAFHLVSATVNFDLNEIFGNGFSDMEFTFHGTNLINEDIYYPEYARGNINTIPQASGRLLYGTLSIKF